LAVFGNSLGKISPRSYDDLLKGLSSHPKRIPSKYFYDDRGSRIFARITELEEYYPTHCEDEILSHQAKTILEFCDSTKPLNIVELGAGDGRKTIHLLRAGVKHPHQVTYRPVDISLQALRDLSMRFKSAVPKMKINPCQIDLEQGVNNLPIEEEVCNLILFLGSSIGNYDESEQRDFLLRLREMMNPGDFVLLGFDLKKDPRVLRRAYDDRHGVTREFNMNLLRRLNREIDADFDEKHFRHLASYNPGTGAMESWLISQKEQTVHLNALGAQLTLEAFEGIHVETSWKFSRQEIRSLAIVSGFEQLHSFYDAHYWFVDELWEA
jgi:dimethylhistidine N-methyltransferase